MIATFKLHKNTTLYSSIYKFMFGWINLKNKFKRINKTVHSV